MYQQKYEKRKKRKFRLVVFSFCMCLILVVCYVFFVVNPVVVEATKATVFSLSTSAVSDAVCDVLGEEGFRYEDLVHIETNSQNEVVFISLDTVKLNLMARKFYQVAQIYLDQMGKYGVDVALGTFTGLPFLVGIGPKVSLKLMPIGAMTSVFESKFEGAGVNNTEHSLYIKLYASVSLVLPAYSTTVDSVTEVLVAESVISGKVPQVYLGANSPLTYSPAK